ncbi:MAG TPA: spore germination protein GerW family protein [Actinomycetes bacterium]|nr:spore germination protein GerW family protein [Actinomycetes bacterium]
MDVQEILSSARNTLTTKTVFAEPYEADGLTVIPAAKVAGGGGGGSGEAEDGQTGDGGGFGMMARPAGAYVIDQGKVRWQPAVDVNRIIATVGAVVVTALVTRAITAPWRARRTEAKVAALRTLRNKGIPESDAA